MTFTSLITQHRAALAMLATVMEQNRAYAEVFGYPSGRTCPHCRKEAFGQPENLDALAGAPPEAQVAHDYCLEIASLKATIAKMQADPPTLHIHELPKPKAQEDDDPANPDAPPVPERTPAPAPDPANPDAEEVSSACA
jgi:hypothetical protein